MNRRNWQTKRGRRRRSPITSEVQKKREGGSVCLRGGPAGCEFPLKEIHLGNAHDDPATDPAPNEGLDLIDLRQAEDAQPQAFP